MGPGGGDKGGHVIAEGDAGRYREKPEERDRGVFEEGFGEVIYNPANKILSQIS